MRYIGAIAHSFLRIGLYSWNGKYIVKIETGPYEQTYKISETDVASEEEVTALLDDEFLAKVNDRFQQMHADWSETAERNSAF